VYELLISPELDIKLKKVLKKNRKHFDLVLKKSKEIVLSPYHYKNLRKPLQHLKRVHIDKHFVLTFSVNEELKQVVLEDFNHHDIIYR